MLKFCPKHPSKTAINAAKELSQLEDELIRKAFGRFGGSKKMREAAAEVVQKYQTAGSGRWLLCDCLPHGETPPVLLPISGTHIKRHVTKDPTRGLNGDWPNHAEWCDFRLDPKQQRAVVRTHKRSPPPLAGYRLLRAFKKTSAKRPSEGTRHTSRHEARSGLATILSEIVVRAGLQLRVADGSRPSIAQQYKDIENAAGQLLICKNVPIDRVMCRHPSKFDALKDKLQSDEICWPKSVRPHGIFIIQVDAIERGHLVSKTFGKFPVRSRIAVFGEPDGDTRPPTSAFGDARSPYLAIAVVGQAVPDGEMELVSAYVHPCLSRSDLMLVDSDMERITLKKLHDLRDMLKADAGVEVSIEKPLFDIGPDELPGNDDIDDEGESGEHSISQDEAEGGEEGDDNNPQPRPVCIPDFILHAVGGPSRGNATVIVETMGFSNSEYRERKERIHGAMREALKNAPLEVHDFHLPAGSTQEQRNEQFLQDVQRAIMGPMD